MSEDIEQTAQRIAQRGRDALLARLRPAFEEAAAAHADVLELAPEQLDQMVRDAADRADGLQWRRALAAVAGEELGIGLGEALSHPAVERAQQIVGAPSYEESLAALGQAAPRTEPEPEPEPEEADLEDEEGELADEDDLADLADEDQPADEDDEQEPATESSPRVLRLAAVHLGGIANLAPGEADLQLRFSRIGLDVVRDPGAILGRLRWHEVRSLEVSDSRGWRRRRRGSEAQLVLRTRSGDASFEIPALTAEELREHLEPVRRYLR